MHGVTWDRPFFFITLSFSRSIQMSSLKHDLYTWSPLCEKFTILIVYVEHVSMQLRKKQLRKCSSIIESELCYHQRIPPCNHGASKVFFLSLYQIFLVHLLIQKALSHTHIIQIEFVGMPFCVYLLILFKIDDCHF